MIRRLFQKQSKKEQVKEFYEQTRIEPPTKR